MTLVRIVDSSRGVVRHINQCAKRTGINFRIVRGRKEIRAWIEKRKAIVARLVGGRWQVFADFD